MRCGRVLLLLVCLGGCDPFAKPDSMLETYIERLGRVLDVTPDPLTPVVTPAYPPPRQRQLAIPGLDVSLLRFLSLYGCELQVVVAERNAIMGRVMQPLNVLRYELRFIEAAQQCLPKLDDDSLKDAISQAVSHKQAHLSEHIWNASFASAEMADFLRRSQGLYALSASPTSLTRLSDQVTAFAAFVEAINAEDWQQRPSMLGNLQQRWQQQATGGQLIRSAEAIIARLNQGTAMLRIRADSRPMCFQQQPHPEAVRMHNMFLSVYIGEVQPYLSSVTRSSQKLFGALTTLRQSMQPVMPDTMRPYSTAIFSLQGSRSLWQKLDKSIQLHTKAWQDLLSQCGLRPKEKT